ncbi:MAG: phosphotransferase family protein [Nocardioides sp.]
MTQTPPSDFRVQRSSRDASTVPDRLATWLATVLPEGADPVVTLEGGVDTTGMSSETLVLDAAWTQAGGPRIGRFVARVAPADDDVPVFPGYDLPGQYDVMRLVGELTEVPVPTVRWLEPTGDVLGMPFFLMDRVEGHVPPDVMPYTFGDNWLFDASPTQRRRLQDTTIDTIAALHAIPDADTRFGFLEPDAPGRTPLARSLAEVRRWHTFAAEGIGPSRLVERGLAWLEAHLPDGTDTVLSWGDSRIGNVIYEDFTPVAVLDWEMAGVGPRELDLAWLVFSHRVFQTIAAAFGLPGMPDFLREEDVRAAYAERTGVEVGDLSWFQLFAAVQWAIVFLRTGTRQLRFGEIEPPGEVEELMHHRPLLEQLLDEVHA